MESKKSLKTYFDIPERKDLSDVRNEASFFSQYPLLNQVLEGFPEMVYVLNEYRQIIALNSRSINLSHSDGDNSIIGKRFGEMINCIHSDVEEAGCGTSKFCAECGVAKAIKYTNDTKEQKFEECRITSNISGIEVSYDFLVHTTPLEIEGRKFTIYALKNIENDKRRFALEKIFFHDVLNTTGAVSGFANLLKETSDPDELDQIYDALIDSSSQLLNEILSQRELRNAEEGNLKTHPSSISINEILKKSYNLYAKQEIVKGKSFTVEYQENDLEIYTDHFIVIRSIGNLIKNAIEASREGDEIKIYSEINEEEVKFNVYNNRVIPENIQFQIFKRSFSTKDSVSRGIGTYSVKLLIEQYLNGSVAFTSKDKKGTVFTIALPLKK